MLNKKHNLKSGKSKDKRKGFQRDNKTGNKKEKGLMKTNFVIEQFDVVLFMKQKQRRKKKEERDKNKEPKESKKERQEGRKKEDKKRERERERQRKRK